MYEFHYGYINNKYGNDSSTDSTDTDGADTDSLMCEIKTN